jgi:hypothetical protein
MNVMLYLSAHQARTHTQMPWTHVLRNQTCASSACSDHKVSCPSADFVGGDESKCAWNLFDKAVRSGLARERIARDKRARGSWP